MQLDVIELEWEREENPGWDGTGTIAESWYTQHGEYTARIDRFHDEEGGYAYTVDYMGNPVRDGENVAAESFEAAEAAVLRLVGSR